METIIGLGSAGCNIAGNFEKYPQYKVYKLNSKDNNEKRYLKLKQFETVEEYESKPPKLANFFRGISEEKILFIVCGASAVASASLVILEQLAKKKCEIHILYVVPEIDLLGETKTLQERVIRNILQQYARSGLFSGMTIASNESMESMSENLTVLNYHETINELLTSTIHMLNIFDNTQSVSDTFSSPAKTARIQTFGFVDFESGEEKLFFSLDNIREMRYYYAIPQTKLETEIQLFRKIVNQAKSRLTSDTKVSYGIYSTEYESEYVYVLCYSSKIQEK